MSKNMTYWSISSQVLTEEARNLGLSVEVLIPKKNLYCISGNNKQILFKCTDFGSNTALGYQIAGDKEITHIMLEKKGYPFARTVYVSNTEIDDFDYSILEGFRYPLVIKPTDEDHGNGIHMNILHVDELKGLIETSLKEYDRMMIQEQIVGRECRVVVGFDTLMAAYIRNPPTIIGDGVSTVEELIDRENSSNTLRGAGYESPLSYIQIDAKLVDFIGKQGLKKGSVLEKDLVLQLRGNSNISTGGIMQDITQSIHASYKSLCLEVATYIGLDFCGIDIISSDFTRPISETGGVILEINANPGLGGDREVLGINIGKIILEKLFFTASNTVSL